MVKGGLQMPEVYPLVPALGIDIRFAVDGWGVSLLLLTGIIIFAGVSRELDAEGSGEGVFHLPPRARRRACSACS